MTSPTVRRPVADLPKDPAHIYLDYRLEASLGLDSHEDTIEQWEVTAHLGEEFDLDDIPPCEACVAGMPVLVDESDDGCPHRSRVGSLTFYKVRLDGSQNPFWAMEEESQDLAEIAAIVFNPELTRYTPEFSELIADGGGGFDLLVAYSAELSPAWRGFGLGPILAGHAVRHLEGGCGAVICHPTPIDSSGMTPEDWRHACERLRETWAKAGFQPFGDTPYMAYATGWAAPEQRRAELRNELKALSREWRAARQP